MNKITLIGVSGNGFSCGKGEVSNYFQDKNFIEVNFGDKVKETCSVISGLPLYFFYNPDLKNKSFPQLGGRSIREFMQFIGTDCVRQFYRFMWIDRVKDTLRDKEVKYGYSTFIISDVRFPEEVLDGMILIHVENPNLTPHYLQKHESESYSRYLKDRADYVVVNDGSISDLRDKCQFIYEDVVNRTC